MKSVLQKFIIGAVFLLIPTSAFSDLIVNTGDPTYSTTGDSFTNSQWLAGQFSLSETYTITGLEGYFKPANFSNFIVDVFVYGNSLSDLPNDTALIHTSFILTGGAPEGWFGDTGIDESLNAGTYWLAFQTSTKTADTTALMNYGPPNPASKYAFRNAEGSNVWADRGIPPVPEGQGTMAFRINGELSPEPAPVPEPTTMLLFGTGLAGLAGFKSRKKKK